MEDTIPIVWKISGCRSVHLWAGFSIDQVTGYFTFLVGQRLTYRFVPSATNHPNDQFNALQGNNQLSLPNSRHRNPLLNCLYIFFSNSSCTSCNASWQILRLINWVKWNLTRVHAPFAWRPWCYLFENYSLTVQRASDEKSSELARWSPPTRTPSRSVTHPPAPFFPARLFSTLTDTDAQL